MAVAEHRRARRAEAVGVAAVAQSFALRMLRRARRSGVRFIEDDRDRSLTFFKRRSGLFKAASDLSALTGARNAPIDSDTSEEDKARITSLQNELFQVEKAKATEDKRKDENMARAKEIQETSWFSKFVYGSIEDLDAHDLFEMYRELSRIRQEINDLSPTFAP
ncbi:uncharacterized protein [Miscanthus floridulus]|uniref:uncharacterized protein n=1 Tax=Miscanthus floridulus TaxID=154761 RepID=UPI00345B0975